MTTIDHHSLSGLSTDRRQRLMIREVVVRGSAVESELGWSVRSDDLLLAVRGDVCTATVQPLIARMCELAVQFPVRVVTLDLADVTFADARMVRLLTELERACITPGSILTVGEPSPAAERLMQLCGIGGVSVVETP